MSAFAVSMNGPCGAAGQTAKDKRPKRRRLAGARPAPGAAGAMTPAAQSAGSAGAGPVAPARSAAAFAALAAIAAIAAIAAAAPAARAQTTTTPAACLLDGSVQGVSEQTDPSGNPICIFEVPPDWALVPSGIGRGDKFRLLFATSSHTQATRSDIAYYNGFVAGRAGMSGHSAIRPYADAFTAMVSTATGHSPTDGNSISVNTQTDYRLDLPMYSAFTQYDKAIPVYWLNGSRISENYGGLYDNAWDNESSAHWRNETGTGSGFASVLKPWTGSFWSGIGQLGGYLGRAASDLGIRGSLGENGTFMFRGGTVFIGPLNGDSGRLDTAARLLALSPVFRVSLAPSVVLSVKGGRTATVREGAADPTLTIAATLSSSNDTGGDLSIPVRVRAAGTTATAGEDYTLAATSITIARNAMSGTTELTVVNDNLRDTPDDADEVLIVEIGEVPSADEGKWTRGEQSSVTVRIEDDDVTPEIFVRSPQMGGIDEGENATFYVFSGRPLLDDRDSDLTVSLQVSESVYGFHERFGTAHDYGYVAASARSVTLTAAADAAAATAMATANCGGFDPGDGQTAYNCNTLTVAVADDSVDEPDGSVRVAVQSGTGYTSRSAASVTVRDVSPTAVTLEASPRAPDTDPIDVREGDPAAARLKLTVSRPLAPSEQLTARLDFGGDAGVVLGGDYTVACVPPEGAGVFCSMDLGGRSGAGGVPLPRGADGMEDAAAAASVVIEGSAAARVIDTAVEVELELRAVPDRKDEGGEQVTIGFGDAALCILDGSRTCGYTPGVSASVLQDAGGTKLKYRILDQKRNVVTLSAAFGYASSVAEGSAAALKATLDRANATGRDIVIPIRAREYGGDPADAADAQAYIRTVAAARRGDYALGAGWIRIAAGEREGEVEFEAADDSRDEPDETVVIEVVEDDLPALGNVHAAAGNGGRHTFVIGDGDATAVTLRVTDGVADEGDETDDAGIEIALGRTLGWALTPISDGTLACAPETLRVPLEFERPTPDGGLEEEDHPSGDFTLGLVELSESAGGVSLDLTSEHAPAAVFGLGTGCAANIGDPAETDARAVVALMASQDTDLDEETLIVSMGAPAASGLDGGIEAERIGDGRILILDEDQPEASFDMGGRVIERAEGNPGGAAGAVDLAIRLTPAPNRSVRVGYTVTGAASAGADYRIADLAGNSGFVEIGARQAGEDAGSKSAPVAVHLLPDRIAEGNEALTLTLFAGRGHTVAEAAGAHTVTVRIVDDDAAGVEVGGAPGDPLQLEEGGAPGCYSLRLTSDPGPGREVTIVTRSSDRGAVAADIVDRASGIVCANGELSGAVGDDLLSDRAVFRGGECAAGDRDSAGDWCEAQVVRVSPVDDDDGAPESLEIEHTVLGYADGSGAPVEAPAVGVSVEDKEPTACFAAAGGGVPRLSERGACEPAAVRGEGGESGGGDTVAVRIRLVKRDGAARADGDIELRYNVSGSATPGAAADTRGADYWIPDRDGDGGPDGFSANAGAGAVTVKAGADHADIEVRIIDDEARDIDETVIFTLADGPGYVLGGNTYELLIADDDTVALVFLGADGDPASAPTAPGRALRLREGGGPACYRARLATDPVGTAVVQPQSSNPGVAAVDAIGAGECGDERAAASDRLIFSGGECIPGDPANSDGDWCEAQAVRVTPRGDTDSADSLGVRINHQVSGYAGIESVAPVYVDVVDRIEAGFGATAGGGGAGATTESSAGECPGPPGGNGGAECGAGAEHRHEIRIALTRAPLPGEDPAVLRFLAGGSAAAGRDYNIAGGAVCAADPAAAGGAGVCFDAGNGEGAIWFDAGNRTDAAGGAVWAPAASVGAYAILPVDIISDDIVEGDETVIVGLLPGPNHTVDAASIHTLTLVDDDGGPGVTVAPTSLRLTEGGANGAYTVVLNTDPDGEVEVFVDTGNADSVTVSTDVLSFSSGDWNLPQTVVVSALDDDDGADERATLFHTVAGYGDVATAAPVEVAVIDDDDNLADTVVSIVAGPAIVEGGLAEFTVSATPVPEEALTVNVEVTDSGEFARGGQAGPRPVIVGSDGTARLTVATVDDGDDEPDGRIEATVGIGRGYTVASPPSDSAAVAVADDDDPVSIPRAAFAEPASVRREGDAPAELRVGISPPPESAVALNYTLGGTAALDEDYRIAGADGGGGAVAVAAGADAVFIAVTFLQDNRVEGDETVTIALAAGRGYEVGAAGVHTLTLEDDDSAGVSVSPRSLTVEEGGANGAYTVSLGTDPGGTVTVTPFLDDPGAAAVSGSLSFTSENWREAQRVLVSALDDADAGNESVTVSHRVSGYPGVDAAPDVTVTVIDDDVDLGDPVVSIAAAGAIEEGGLARFTLRADPPPGAPFAVNVAVADPGGFAAVGQAGSRPVTIGTGGTAELTVATVDDRVEEAGGALTATVGAGPGYEAAAWPDNQAAVDVADNDREPPTPEVAFETSGGDLGEAEAAEGSGVHVAAIRIVPAIEVPLTLAFAISGTAERDADYAIADSGGVGGIVRIDGAGGTVEVAAGADSAEIRVTVADDLVNEPAETVVLTLAAAPAGGPAYTVADRAGAYTAHTLTIADDDAAAGLQAQAAPALARLGRSLSEQLMLGVEGRLAARRRMAAAREPGSGFSATFAGRGYWLDPGAGGCGPVLGGGSGCAPGAAIGAPGAPASGPLGGRPADGPGRAAPGLRDGGVSGIPYGSALGALHGTAALRSAPGAEGHGLRFGDLLRRAVAGSSFLGVGPQIGGGELGFWGRGATTGFSGASDDFALDGSMTSVQLGADWTGVWMTAGLMLSQGGGTGEYRQGGVRGEVEMTLSSVVPYLGYQVGERVSLWSAVSVSVGDLSLKHVGGDATEMDLSMRAFGAGGRGEVYRGGGAFTLSVVSDVFAAGAETDPVPGLPDVQAGASRFRLAAEGAWTRDLPGGGRLANRTELGLRVDGGDAEEGVGAELANATSLSGAGLTAELEGRRLLMHADEGFSQYGVSLHLAWDPMPQSPTGPVATLRRAWGIDSASGVGRLYGMRDLAAFGAAPAGAGRAALEVGWGVIWLRDLYVLTPTLSAGASGGAREAGLGLRLAPSEHNARDISAGFGATWSGTSGRPGAPSGGAGGRGGTAGFELTFRLRW